MFFTWFPDRLVSESRLFSKKGSPVLFHAKIWLFLSQTCTMIGTLLLLLLPFLLNLGLLFIKDRKTNRGRVLNVLVLLNALLFLLPVFMALINTPSGESIWNESSGGGAAFWLYYFVWPACAVFLLLLLVLKLIFNRYPRKP
jgi:hypothetical protein